MFYLNILDRLFHIPNLIFNVFFHPIRSRVTKVCILLVLQHCNFFMFMEYGVIIVSCEFVTIR